MEDFLLMELLRSKGKSDPEFKHRFKEYMHNKYAKGKMRDSHYPEDMKTTDWDFSEGYDRFFDKLMSEHYGEHFDESHARHIVNQMYHKENDRVVSGEHFSMHKAKDVCETYSKLYHLDITPEDTYIAINAQYHDYYTLFKSWFGTNTDNKIIESAICFWFKDADYTKGSKLMHYFQED